ncbi:nuclear transport factor 2 family protein [Chitiniphilus purpureus]|uniref:Nuclear transport factor 2 family protein n=1 Tax=Chitiniphilus purpureus TaxID=2981137 RepID=A0ABY6DPN8_9NEIS|nr:nuclear transport factor 2 family protein [Chitiniphilus sp. CD1]UXY15446.1 nuclear transport factor 2 family protein [Chitiniphilus sp. CD1]
MKRSSVSIGPVHGVWPIYPSVMEVQLSPTEIREIVDRYIDAYNRKDIDGMLLTVHPQVEFKNISADVVNAHTQGVDELRALARQSLPLFAERNQSIRVFEVDGATATALIDFHAVVAADLPNGLKKGQVLDIPGRSEFEFQDGMIARITDIS